MYTRESLLAFHESFSTSCRDLMALKNKDYATDADPLSSFRDDEEFGIVVRLGDKVRRLRNFIRNGKMHVKDESAIDTLRDIINYAVLMVAYMYEREQNGGMFTVGNDFVMPNSFPAGAIIHENRISKHLSELFEPEPDDE